MPATHLIGRDGYTACGKNITHNESRTSYWRESKKTPRKSPLETTSDFDEVRCAACQNGFEYKNEMSRRRTAKMATARATLEENRTHAYKLFVEVGIYAADDQDAIRQAHAIFGGRRAETFPYTANPDRKDFTVRVYKGWPHATVHGEDAFATETEIKQ